MSKVSKKLRDDPLWRNVFNIAQTVYGKLDDIISNYPEEEWNTASKLRNAANDSMFFVSQALGNKLASNASYDWNEAHKHLFALQSTYIFAAKQKYLELDPDVVVCLDNALEIASGQIEASEKAADKDKQEDLEPWLEKYRIWQKMQDK
jgi:hypothetical protein